MRFGILGLLAALAAGMIMVAGGATTANAAQELLPVRLEQGRKD